MPHFETLGDRMKFYEKNTGVGTHLMPGVPWICRVDGKAFHSLTRGMKKPFDLDFVQLMDETAKYLLEETVANFVYAQSDEISLCWHSENRDTQLFFDGKIQKMVSISAALATEFFNRGFAHSFPDRSKAVGLFDSRVFSVPSTKEAVNYLRWRIDDATRNSLSMLAQSYYSSTELHGKGKAAKHEMLYAKGVNWNDLPNGLKNGRLFQKKHVTRSLTFDEIKDLPPKHDYFTKGELTKSVTVVQSIELPQENLLGALFNANADGAKTPA